MNDDNCLTIGLEDIEDIYVPNSTEDEPKRLKTKKQKKQIIPRKQTKKEIKERKEIFGYDIPGKQVVYLKTYGCSHNNSDSEYMAGQLAQYGYGITEDFDKADVYLLNSCTVKNPSQDTFESLIQKAKTTKKPVVVAGCVPQGEPNDKKWEGLSVVGVQNIDRVVEVVEQSIKGNTVHLLQRTKKNTPSLALPKIRRNPHIEIVAVNLGCLNHCTYCKTKHARGDLKSYPIADIIERITQAINEGVKEIRLTSEDTGAYGRDIGTNIVELLREIIKILPDGVMLRIGMTNPPYILDHLDDIAEIMKHPNVYEFLHLPVQSGSSKVLYDMKREYTQQDFCRVVETLRDKVPGITLGTDIICGFPTEKDEDFEETMKLIEKYKFPVLYISQFYPRPGTPAAAMKRIATDIVKERSRRLTKLFESYTTFDNLVGTIQRVWITEYATDGQNLVGHTKNYVQVIVDPKEAKIGTDVYCKIESCGKFFVKGKVIDSNEAKALLEKNETKMEQKLDSKEEKVTTTEAKQKGTKQKSNDGLYWIILGLVPIVLLVLLYYFL